MRINLFLKVCSLLGLVLFLVVGLGSPNYQPRSGLGWEFDHFVGYFVLTVVFCLAWPRRLLVVASLIVFAVLLEGLQALPRDRSSNMLAALYSAGGVLTSAVFVELLIRAWWPKWAPRDERW
jgi:VanZ family protein